MLTALSIRDIVLIEKLDIALEKGLTVLTGETGAGKSILLDALGLALGARGDSSLVRAGAERGVVTAAFALPRSHPAFAILKEQGVDAEGELVIRRIQNADGPSRAAINDQPVSLNLLRQIAGALAEIHGQHADRALVDVTVHRRLLDAFGGHDAEVSDVAALWARSSAAEEALNEHRALMDRAEAERDYLEHAADELRALNPIPGEEALLAEARQMMMSAEQYAEALTDAGEALAGDGTSVARLNAALRKLERRRETAGGRLDHVCQALDRVLAEVSEAERAIAEAQRAFVFDPKELEKSEERLFALRAAARKFKCTVDTLADVRERFDNELKALSDGGGRLRKLERDFKAAREAYDAAAEKLSNKRRKTAKSLDKAVMDELPPLKLERARFETALDTDAGRPGSTGIDRVEFMVSANPGTPLAPLMKVASGGELARFMLALKVILASKGSAPTLIFDEIDTGVGGAVADAIGARLARLASNLQVLAVTHSPQVAARASQHMLISKMEEVASRRMVTRVQPLSGQSRREEVARMLSGARVTDAARAQADELLGGRG
ncbi:MAG: DNA repair protein RecN [Aestuariivirga sp.]|uniref:DNA repair protein RecN n=1 Tax=Aestuariivirga sp. TaxID=2650926 RepID=UPI0025C3B353|nr:DNA repair protein RecN [Aestuariivirga sp.]MCA3560411.1 DNA repair protein RecN [Aestuariivirga sp.]